MLKALHCQFDRTTNRLNVSSWPLLRALTCSITNLQCLIDDDTSLSFGLSGVLFHSLQSSRIHWLLWDFSRQSESVAACSLPRTASKTICALLACLRMRPNCGWHVKPEPSVSLKRLILSYSGRLKINRFRCRPDFERPQEPSYGKACSSYITNLCALPTTRGA
jgi:hypothetical protein